MGFHVAVVGATGAVGRTMVRVLEERDFPVDRLTLLATERSAGQCIHFHGEPHRVEAVSESKFEGVGIALFSAGSGPSTRLTPQAAKRGAVVIDNSSAFRMDENVPLVVPEVNPEAAHDNQGIIANPNCSTIQLVVALKPLHDAARVKRVVVATYQSVSGSGQKAVDELEEQLRAWANGEAAAPSVYPHRIAFNALPHIGDFQPDGYSTEEWKMHHETRKILADESLHVTATTVRVPVAVGHAEAVNVETRDPLDPERARTLLAEAPGVVVRDEPGAGGYPLPIHCEGRDALFVGRIRRDFSIQNGLNLWVVADNLRKGAATNAVQVAELLT